MDLPIGIIADDSDQLVFGNIVVQGCPPHQGLLGSPVRELIAFKITDGATVEELVIFKVRLLNSYYNRHLHLAGTTHSRFNLLLLRRVVIGLGEE